MVLSRVAAAGQTTETQRLDSVVVSASRAADATPVTYSYMGVEQLQSLSPMSSLPLGLSMQPSVVAVNEGGTGLGYSKLTVRGSKGSQINVTLNGITLNDAESQEVFWVNIPALNSVLGSVQLQRGLGTTANGSGAFGASINMATSAAASDNSFMVDLGGGSFGTATGKVSMSTGIQPGGWHAKIAWTLNHTDGYIDGGWVDASSVLAVLGRLTENDSFNLTYLLGQQASGITWTGEPYAMMATERRYNPEGLYLDENGVMRRYRRHSDNYLQQHLQLNWTHRLSQPLVVTSTLNYTSGYGYNERYKSSKKLKAYGFGPEFSYAALDNSAKGDVIFRKTMANDYWVLNSELRYRTSSLTLTGGVNASVYDGDHFGELRWAQVLGGDYPYSGLNHRSSDNNWYFNNGLKREANVFARGEWLVLEHLNVYADLQYRLVGLRMRGVDDEYDLPMAFRKTWSFFNPRAGLSWVQGPSKFYASVALGHREPGRSDIKEVIESNNLEGGSRELKPESMVDVELGYRLTGRRVGAEAVLYLMEYRNMLLETGELSASGYAIKDNVNRSYRRGLELSAFWAPSRFVRLDGNITLSSNKILDYTQFWEVYDNSVDWNYLGQDSRHYDKVDMLLSPSLVSAASVDLRPFSAASASLFRDFDLKLDAKYVGSQYWDNTADSERRIPAWWTLNLTASQSFRVGAGSLVLSLYVNNLLDRKYYGDAWVYRAYMQDEGKFYQEEGVFPQACTNAMLRVSYSF